MKVAFTTSGDSLDAALDARFGRAPRFLVCDTDSGAVEVIDNQKGMDAAQGAGIQAAQTVARAGVQAVVTGHCGPKAFRVLSEAGVAVYTTDAATVAEALERFRSGALTEARSADVDGHWV
ncbi:MAG: dinitrogenase iron-molybdenum cofactor biosynthesis protein [Candidatus Latescibacterota bacterium]|jgi:predicted Fe-Mo cluster-binding NifX family protein|nr:MAG: dinitrogenase iron-molybdenum cofactor biosynthesis protein [Candidatus Latescibacterota bacterium]